MNGIYYFEEYIGVLRKLGKKGQDGGERKGKRRRRRKGEAFYGAWERGRCEEKGEGGILLHKRTFYYIS
jgi:hypothetical protein